MIDKEKTPIIVNCKDTTKYFKFVGNPSKRKYRVDNDRSKGLILRVYIISVS